MSTHPTDAEIIAVAATEGVRVRTGAAAIKFARAVLAKWGTPAPVGVEPLIPFRHGCKWCGETTGCKHTPQPIQAQPVAREPLTHAQAKALVLKYGNDPLNLVFQVELANGIKGGQHGPI